MLQTDFVQNSIFEIRTFQTPEEIARGKRKRGFYKPKEIKPITLNPYAEMKNLYEKLANYLPLPLFSNDEGVFIYGKIKYWYMVYTDEAYTYQGNKYDGENFNVVEAEIIGTENLDIEKRVKLYKQLIELLHKGIKLDKAITKLGY